MTNNLISEHLNEPDNPKQTTTTKAPTVKNQIIEGMAHQLNELSQAVQKMITAHQSTTPSPQHIAGQRAMGKKEYSFDAGKDLIKSLNDPINFSEI